uniref:Bifunctional lysine-specific demethylase and histidyl-hydroxylase n=2 Tax=Chrysotila carterae TaxID=13221 RepID=A0A7S4B2V6_CHRCT
MVASSLLSWPQLSLHAARASRSAITHSRVHASAQESPQLPEIDVMVGFGDAQRARFLSDFWGRKPLLVRSLLSSEEIAALCPLSPDDLLELACDEEVSSRLVGEDGNDCCWTLEHGPFDFDELSSRIEDELPCTLLVQEVDRQVPEVESLRDKFNFVPRWRLDDVMVSYARAGGSIGAHVDNYDVFLLQGSGQKRWDIEVTTRSAADENLRKGLDVRILSNFAPSHSQVLRAGDALYLPPRHAHWGVSAAADCLTYSVGFRAPTAQELVESLVNAAAQRVPSDSLWNMSVPLDPADPFGRGRISRQDVAYAKQVCRDALDAFLGDDAAFEDFLGSTLTRPKRKSRTPSATAWQSPASLPRWTSPSAPHGDMSPASLLEFADFDFGESHMDSDDLDDEDAEEDGLSFFSLAELEGGLVLPAEGSQLVVERIAADAPGAPTLRHAETAVLAFIPTPDASGCRLFLDGQPVPVQPDAEAHLPLLCARSRLIPADLSAPLRESQGLRSLVAKLLACDALYEEL